MPTTCGLRSAAPIASHSAASLWAPRTKAVRPIRASFSMATSIRAGRNVGVQAEAIVRIIARLESRDPSVVGAVGVADARAFVRVQHVGIDRPARLGEVRKGTVDPGARRHRFLREAPVRNEGGLISGRAMR